LTKRTKNRKREKGPKREKRRGNKPFANGTHVFAIGCRKKAKSVRNRAHQKGGKQKRVRDSGVRSNKGGGGERDTLGNSREQSAKHTNLKNRRDNQATSRLTKKDGGFSRTKWVRRCRGTWTLPHITTPQGPKKN